MFKKLLGAAAKVVGRIATVIAHGAERGVAGMSGLIYGIIAVIVGALILGKVLPALWPTFVGSGADIASLTQTDTSTEVLQALWPTLLIIIGIGAVAAAIFWALRHFGMGHKF